VTTSASPSLQGSTVERALGPAPRLILASSSPRRKSLLEEAGYEFLVVPANVDEKVPPQILPVDLAEQLAETKGRAVAPGYPEDVVLAADTVVSFGDYILGKPNDAAHARTMLNLLSGTTHLVITGVFVVRQSMSYSKLAHVMSAVRMNTLSNREIEEYVASNLWQGKAGGYGIQDPDPFVERIRGCHTNIVGLPMKTTKRLLEAAGVFPRPQQ
jgi:septum formation protein